MTDKQFEKAMRECGDAHRKYLSKLEVIEGEYIDRYGIHPSDVNNDFWIDTFHCPPGADDVTVKMLEESVKLYHRNKQNATGSDTGK